MDVDLVNPDCVLQIGSRSHSRQSPHGRAYTCGVTYIRNGYNNASVNILRQMKIIIFNNENKAKLLDSLTTPMHAQDETTVPA